MRLIDKTALITGAARGFGFGIAETFAREGARVALLDLDEEAAIAAANQIGGNAFALRCDVADLSDVGRAVAAVIEAFGKIDIVVNNAGISHRNKPMLEVTEEE
jgi:3-oxoacyl-[acyl-carrier protein] reductase